MEYYQEQHLNNLDFEQKEREADLFDFFNGDLELFQEENE